MEHAIDKNPKNDHGETPLHFTGQLGMGSITNEKLEICQYIIENVDDIDPENVDGEEPLDYPIVELLKAKRKNTNT